MRKGLSLILFGLLAGATAFLVNLLKQKNAALENAQARIAQVERRMSQMVDASLTADQEAQLRAQLADQAAEIERLRLLVATLESKQQTRTEETAFAQRRASDTLTVEKSELLEHAPQRFQAGGGWQERTPALVALGQSLANLSTAKLAFANRALQARVVPTVVEQPQDLSAVEGIGAIFEQRLYNAGIGAYWELATLDDETLLRLLKIGKAQAAAVNLDAMRASARQLAEESNTVGYIWSGEPVDDFEPIPGIGKIYEQRLYSAGIRTYAALAQATPEMLQQAVASRAPIPPDYTSWIEAAKKLAKGKIEE
ncbi:MAG: helix-hairpin-helix domain-containing protein [Caldilinea sp.]